MATINHFSEQLKIEFGLMPTAIEEQRAVAWIGHKYYFIDAGTHNGAEHK
jgi:hypothetical protein